MTTEYSEKGIETVSNVSANAPETDIEVLSVKDVPPEFAEKKDLRRGLEQRHIQMIALAGTIGTGLFLGSGRALSEAGPAGAFMGYTITGILASGVCVSIAELSALIPLSGGIIRHAEYLVDPALSFAQGWNTVYAAMISIPAEVVAAAVIVSYWADVNNAVWITVFGGLVWASNLFLVRIYGELEFAFATLKIMLIVGMNIMGLVITCGGGPNHTSIGFRYWKTPGPFVQYLDYPGSLGRFMGFFTVFSNAVYAYSNIESISMAASETKSPRTNIPKAAKRIFWRVVLFYVISTFMVTLLVASDDPALLQSHATAAESPFVIAAQRAGVKAVPSIINFVVLTSAFSAGNTGLLNGSRTLYGLAQEKHAPAFLRRTSRWGVPYAAVLSVGIWIALGYMSLSSSAATVFTWLQDLLSAAAIVSWIVICAVYLRFFYAMKTQGISRDDLPWKFPFQPYAAWISLIMMCIILFFGGYTTFLHGHWDTETFVSAYVDIAIFLVLYFGFKIVNKTKIIPLSEVPIRRFLDIAAQECEPPAAPPKGLRKFNFLWE